MNNFEGVDFTNIDFLESLVNKDKEVWIKVLDFEFKFVEKEYRERTKFVFKGVANKNTEQEVGIDLFFNSFENWRNVKLFNILEEETIKTLKETGKATDEDLNKDIPFSQKLLDKLLTKYNIGNDLLIEVHKLQERKKKELKKK